MEADSSVSSLVKGAATPSTWSEVSKKRIIRKLDWRVLLPCTVVVFVSFVDRSNIGYAAQDLCNDLKLTHEEYGFGVSLFYAGYVLTQLLGNVLLRRLGAPTWMAVMMFTWGCVATAFGFIQNTAHFYVLRVLLGLAEGGTFPAIWNYLSLFYAVDQITGAYGVIISAISFAMPLSAPISAGLLALGESVGVKGWRLLFIVEGLMPIAFALFLYFRLPSTPDKATFLELEEKKWISSELKEYHDASRITLLEEVKIVVSSVPFWLGTICLLLGFGISNVLMSWATLIIHDMLYGEDDTNSETCGSADGETALSILLTAVPYLVSGVACLVVRRFTLRNRPRFVAILKVLGGLTLVGWAGARDLSFAFGFILLTGSIGLGYIAVGPLTGLTLSFFDASTHATASAMYNMVSSSGGLVFPPIIGRLIDDYGYGVAVPVSGGVLILAAVIILFVSDPISDEQKQTELTTLAHEQTDV